MHPGSQPQKAARQSPQGDLHDYLKVVGLFFVYFITLGQLAAFSTYQDYYEERMLSSYSPSTISWVGTSQVFLVGIVGLFSGALHDRGYTHGALIPGFVLVVLGLLLLSFSHQYWHVLLSQGFLIGIGGGLVYVPAISIVTHRFSTRSALAIGIAATGSAIGGIIWPIVFRKLLSPIGFAWANRVFTLLVLVLAVVSYCTLTSSHRRAYQFLCIGVFFVLLGYWVPLFYLVPYASRSLGTSPNYASDLLSILNAASLFGRVLPAAVGHKVGAANILLAGTTVLGVLILAWMSIGSIAGITVWSIFLGFTAGSVITIPNAVASRLSQPSNTGLRIGIMWAAGAFAELIGPPVAGALLIERDGRVTYFGCQVFGGLSVLVGAGFLVFPAWFIFKTDNKGKHVEMATRSQV
ncbi:major facilitator superfamily domain-containing protein [Xylaria longipes]|nr:major facilitator superfamily domain-containing protein [Xylaria longipes]